MDRLSALARQVDDAKASAEETNRFVQRAHRAIDEARRHTRVFDTEAAQATESGRHAARRRR